MRCGRGSVLALLALAACWAPEEYRGEADRVSYEIIDRGRQGLLGTEDGFSIEQPADTLRRRLMLDQQLPYSDPASLGSKDVEPIPEWPDPTYFDETDPRDPPPWSGDASLRLGLLDCLQVAARTSRDYQLQKERVFQAALALDFEHDQFRNTWFGLLSTGSIWDSSTEPPTTGIESSAVGGVTRRFENGALLQLNVAFDLVKLLSDTHNSSVGRLADMTIAIPLLRGSGKFVVTEPLKQAERNVVYAIFEFEQFKRVFAVRVATEYYTVLRRYQEMLTEEENYRWLVGATRRALREAEAQRLPVIEADQTLQDELQARDRWISSIRVYEQALDAFKLTLNLPVDAELALDTAELELLQATYSELWPVPPEAESVQERQPADAPVVLEPPTREGGGPLELDPVEAIVLALQNRLDLRVAIGRVFDAQRQTAVSADLLRADLTLFGQGVVGERRSLSQANSPSGRFHADDGIYSLVATVNLPFERTAERNIYRNSLINFEQMVRGAQLFEDQIKLAVRDGLRLLMESREQVQILTRSLRLAQKRVDSTSRFLRVDRASSRDVLEAQTDLVEAKDQYYSALVNYRLAELGLQRDMGLLVIDEEGLWTEFVPSATQDQ